jgi:hypothetical protein
MFGPTAIADSKTRAMIPVWLNQMYGCVSPIFEWIVDDSEVEHPSAALTFSDNGIKTALPERGSRGRSFPSDRILAANSIVRACAIATTHARYIGAAALPPVYSSRLAVQ